MMNRIWYVVEYYKIFEIEVRYSLMLIWLDFDGNFYREMYLLYLIKVIINIKNKFFDLYRLYRWFSC